MHSHQLFLNKLMQGDSNWKLKGSFIYSIIKLLLVESSVIAIFYVIFLIRYAVIINYFGKFFFPIKRKQGVNYCCFQIKIRTKRKEKINLETKYNIQYSVTLYKMNENFSFTSNNQCSCVIIHHIFKDACTEQ